MTNDFGCFAVIESERRQVYKWGLWPHNNSLFGGAEKVGSVKTKGQKKKKKKLTQESLTQS